MDFKSSLENVSYFKMRTLFFHCGYLVSYIYILTMFCHIFRYLAYTMDTTTTSDGIEGSKPLDIHDLFDVVHYIDDKKI